MRADLYFNRAGWLKGLDYRKVILIAFLARLIFASIYDIYVSLTANDILLPDASFYSMRGRYVALLLNRYDPGSFSKEMVPNDRESQDIFLNTLKSEKGNLPPCRSEDNLFVYLIGVIYFIFGYFPLGVRVFNISLSIGSSYFLFKVAKRNFGELTANLFLLVALFLPTQFGYSATISKDFVRVFIISLILRGLYG